MGVVCQMCRSIARLMYRRRGCFVLYCRATFQKRPQCVIVGLGCDKHVMIHWRGYCLNSGQRVGNDVALDGYMVDVRGELRNEIMVKMPR